MPNPKVLSDVLDPYDTWGTIGWSVFLSAGGETCIYVNHADAVKRAREEWPDLEDDLK